MVSVTVACPYCNDETTASIPDQAELKEVKQSYKTGIRGRSKLVEVECACNSHFGVSYQ